ncbi:hypothetical protein [Streptomyces canus]|uniref:hypothetical protein n=1 Tax=Streptomyces canus TaxID=58343 RepID=UPI0027829C05|nr:hypothetical protein [Streptomyces canus]MDQ0760685.1 hypothetical protein [Streptomyces canus]MDQ1070686.1 hypothetical protein [Streptomyces canus]
MKSRTTFAAQPRRKRFLTRTLGTAAVGALAWAALAVGIPGGSHAGAGTAATVADSAPGYAVEDFDYPQADKILAEKNILLKRGDGHITLADCATGTGQLEVQARDKSKVCFDVKGTSGWLTLELPSVYLIRGNDYTTEADMTVGTEEQSYDIAKNTWTPVGESADEQAREWTLLELRTSK